jgi:alpha-tubulin suppressor-like RCC1 family protein
MTVPFRLMTVLFFCAVLCHCRKRPPTIVDVHLGPTHACARENTGKVWCWGPDSMPRAVGEADAVAVGSTGVCFLKQGELRCRGFDVLFTTSDAPTAPLKVGVSKLQAAGAVYCIEQDKNVLCTEALNADATSLRPIVSNVVEWSLGAGGLYHRTAAGVVACEHEGLGSRMPRQVPEPALNCKPAPAFTGATGFAVGKKHVCAISPDHRVVCSGDNSRGQLGAPDLTDVVELSAGDFFTCARLADRTISCWGDNTFNQLARSGVDRTATPVPVYGVLGAVRVSSEGNGTCVALGPEEGVRCFGGPPRSRYGVPGDATSPLNVPMPVRFPK